MLLDFKIDKAIAATAYLIEREGGTDDMFPLIKKLYYADRTALIGWGSSITGDSLSSLKKGPIVSRIYDLLKGKGTPKDLALWNAAIQRNNPHKIILRMPLNKGILSVRERDALDASRITIDSIRGSIAEWLHVNCPEWSDFGESSATIDPSTILRLANKSEEEIFRNEQDNDELKRLDALLICSIPPF